MSVGEGGVQAGRQDDAGDPDTGVVRPEYLSQNVEYGSWSVNSWGKHWSSWVASLQRQAAVVGQALTLIHTIQWTDICFLVR